MAGPDDSDSNLSVVAKELSRRKDAFRRRSNGWQTIHNGIEREHDQIQFQRCGSIQYDLVKQTLGTEKGVDTQLASDMITLSEGYDVAVVVSGDADYIAPVSAVKNLGKLAYSVSFETANGRLLPGGARRLEQCVDGKITLKFEQVRQLLGISEVP